jgi:aerobic carbon-monoxide dehydrogenase medium subunit
VKPSAFAYARPESLSEAVAQLSSGEGSALAIAGGQSLLVLMGLRFTMPDTLVDISRLADLQRVAESPDSVFIGAGTTHAAVEDRRVPDPSHGLMPRVAAKIAYRAVRNLGTIGGSVALADPAADWPACLIALDAAAVIFGEAGERRQQVCDLVRGPYETGLAPGEIILGFAIPRLDRACWGTAKVSRKSGAFADSMAVAVDRGPGRPARIALTGTSSHPRILPRASAWFEAGAEPSSDALREAVIADVGELDPMADAYQRRCHVSTVTRAVLQARTP